MGKNKSQELTLIVFFIALIHCVSVQAKTIINDIRYEGNEVTQTVLLNREIYIQHGDEFDESLVEKSRQAIMDLGLFKSVHYYLEGNYKNDNEDSMDVIFVVEEKYYLLVLPRLKLKDDVIHIGAQIQWNNLFGLNHSLRLLFLDKGETEGVEEGRVSFRYVYPNLFDSAYTIGIELKVENEVDLSVDAVNREDEAVKLLLLRWLNEKGRNHGWFVGGSILHQQRFNKVLSGALESNNIEAFILGANVGFRDIKTHKYNRSGKDYGYSLDWSDERVGSESEFTQHLFYYRSYYKITKDNASNLNVQIKLGHANNKILDEFAFSLGGNDDLRGYDNNRFNGNTLLVTNIEYLTPMKNKPAVRYVYFVDIGNTYDSLRNILHEPLNVGAGLGVRWKLKSFVKIDLRVDVGYGFTDSGYTFSFGTRHTF